MAQPTSCSLMLKTVLLVCCVCCICTHQSCAQNESDQFSDGREESCHQQLIGQEALNCSTREASSDRQNNAKSLEDLESSWHYKYFEEAGPRIDVFIQERSLDERLANTLYAVSTNRIVDLNFFAHDSGDEREDVENMKLAAGEQVDDQLCGAHLKSMLHLMRDLQTRLDKERAAPTNGSFGFNEQHIRLARVLDSFGHFSSALLLGKAYNYGSYEECASSELLLRSHGDAPLDRIPMRFCWARLKIDKHLHEDLRTRSLQDHEMRKQMLDTSICLPQACHTKSFNLDGPEHRERLELVQQLVDSQFKLPRELYLDENLELESVYCHPDATSAYGGLPLTGKLLVIFALLYMALILYSTYAVNAAGGRQSGPMVECFDLNSSFGEFLELNPRPSLLKRIELNTWNLVKVLGCTFVLNGHSRLVTIGSAEDATRAYRMAQEDPVGLMSLAGTLVVDTFLILTGAHLTFALGKSLADGRDKKKDDDCEPTEPAAKKQSGALAAGVVLRGWRKIFITRYFRLIPLLFLFFWFKKTFLIHVFSRDLPFGDNAFNRNTEYGACERESWWSPFILAPGFMPLGRQCVPQAWSVANDLFFCLTTVPLMMLVHKRPRLAIGVGVLLSLGSMHMANKAFDAVDLRATLRLRDCKMDGSSVMFGPTSHLYTWPQYRFCSIVAGMIIGYLLFRYERGEIKQWPGWFRGPVSKFGLLLFVLIFVGAAYLPEIFEALPRSLSRTLIGQMFSVGRILWAFTNSVIFLRMATDWKDNYLMRLAVGKLWQVLVKLNYAMLLIHLDYILFALSASMPGRASSFNIFSLFASTYMFCSFFAVLLYVCFEAPVHKFIRRHVLPRLV